MKTAFLLMNIGTPEAPTPRDVSTYLKEFLMDREILRMPWLIRWILVNLLIVPQRKFKSALAYGKIWTENGSPLLSESVKLVKALNYRLPNNYKAFLGMRYGAPSIGYAIQEIQKQGFEKLVLVPLYPQYAAATTKSSVDAVQEYLRKSSVTFRENQVLPPFYKEEFFIDSWLGIFQGASQNLPAQALLKKFDHVLLSYHGLPESHVYGDNQTCSTNGSCCLSNTGENDFCYRSQCMKTTRALQNKFNLADNQISMSFQSRLGPARWLSPSTKATIENLGKSGVHNLLVLCPSFVTDCLETLEEIAIEGKKTFVQAGGMDFRVLPCLNSHPLWVENLSTHLLRHCDKPH